jgi:hypothetical protein
VQSCELRDDSFNMAVSAVTGERRIAVLSTERGWLASRSLLGERKSACAASDRAPIPADIR